MMHDEPELPEHVRRNRVHWDTLAVQYAGPGERAWARQEPTWEIWRVPESVLHTLCIPETDGLAASDRLLRPAFGMYRIEWPGEVGIEFHLSHGDWLRLLRRSGCEVEDLIEMQAPEGGTTRYPHVTLPWARQWPSEELWKARRRADQGRLFSLYGTAALLSHRCPGSPYHGG